MPTIALYDACVLYPAPLRSLLMYLAISGLYQARWTDAIHEEWMRSVVRDYPDVTREKAERVRDLMNAHVEHCLVSNYEHLIPTLTLPDPDDRHVLAAAIHTGAGVIVTANLADFPADVLDPYGVVARHPDDFLTDWIELEPATVCAAAKRQRDSIKRPAKSVDEYLKSLARQNLPRTVARLRAFAGLLRAGKWSLGGLSSPARQSCGDSHRICCCRASPRSE